MNENLICLKKECDLQMNQMLQAIEEYFKKERKIMLKET